MTMGDRFEQTAADAQLAIMAARRRQQAAHRRREELAGRIEELAGPHPPHGSPLLDVALDQARRRLALAEESCERARLRARRALARRR